MSTPGLSRAVWRKSTRSGANGGQCVEVALLETAVGLRDSKDRGSGPVLVCTPQEWEAFIAGARDGELGRP